MACLDTFYSYRLFLLPPSVRQQAYYPFYLLCSGNADLDSCRGLFKAGSKCGNKSACRF